jgi:hypothetical protein
LLERALYRVCSHGASVPYDGRSFVTFHPSSVFSTDIRDVFQYHSPTPSNRYAMCTFSVPRSPSSSVPSASIFTSLSGSALAAAIARLSLATCAPVDVFRNAASSPV